MFSLYVEVVIKGYSWTLPIIDLVNQSQTLNSILPLVWSAYEINEQEFTNNSRCHNEGWKISFTPINIQVKLKMQFEQKNIGL